MICLFRPVSSNPHDNDNDNDNLNYFLSFQTHEADFLPRMLCDSCIISLNVAYNFKKRAIDADSKLRQYVIEKGLGLPEPSYDYNLAITDGRGGSSVSNFMHSTHALGDFAVPEPLRQSTLHPETTALAHEYLRNFETPQSMTSTSIAQVRTVNPVTERFRCMPIQIKVERIDEGAYHVSPTASEENLQTVSDTSSIRSAMNRVTGSNTNNLASVNDHLANCSDEEFVNHYLRPSPEQNKTQQSESDKSPVSSKSTGTTGTSVTIQTESSSSKSATSLPKTSKNFNEKNKALFDTKTPKPSTTKPTASTKAQVEKVKQKENSNENKEEDKLQTKKKFRDLKNLGDVKILDSRRKRTLTDKFTVDEPVEKKTRSGVLKLRRHRTGVATENKDDKLNKRSARNSGRPSVSRRTPVTAPSSPNKARQKSNNRKLKSDSEAKSTRSEKPGTNRAKGAITPRKLAHRS